MRYDLHLHTKYSSCSTNNIKDIIKVVNKLRLDGIAITDHNSIKGAIKMKKEKKNFHAIVGEEIATDHGEVLALGLNEHIRPGSILEVLDNIKDQGAIASLAHPFSKGIIRKKSDVKEIEKLVKFKKIGNIETFNARCVFNTENSEALKFATQFKLGQTGGSDAHFLPEIGKGLTVCDSDILKEVKDKKTVTVGSDKNALGWRLLSAPVRFGKRILR